MDDNLAQSEPFPDALPGYEVHFTIYGTGVTCTIFTVAYKRGRRSVVKRYHLPLSGASEGSYGPLGDVAQLCGQLQDYLLRDA